MVVLNGELYQLVMVPVLAPLPVAWLAVGFRVDDALARDLRRLTRLQVSFLTRAHGESWRVQASTLSEAERIALVARHATPTGSRTTIAKATPTKRRGDHARARSVDARRRKRRRRAAATAGRGAGALLAAAAAADADLARRRRHLDHREHRDRAQHRTTGARSRRCRAAHRGGRLLDRAHDVAQRRDRRSRRGVSDDAGRHRLARIADHRPRLSRCADGSAESGAVRRPARPGAGVFRTRAALR